MDLPKRYDHKKSEEKWKTYWNKNKIYTFDNKNKKPIYAIDVPPPYASAEHLHVGHALSYTQFEIAARIKRMQGFNVYFAPCFDNNGLPTEKYVEEKFKIDKSSIKRSDFVKLCRKESAKVEKIYSENVFKKLGHSYDWSLLYTTIDLESQRIAQTSFLKLIKQGDCYRNKEPTLWCTKHQTALAQAEVENLERNTKLNYIYFDCDGEKIEIATTRPELLSSCVGIFVNPKDKRYIELIGKKAKVPLFDYEVLIRSDEKVDMKFGSGIVMVCTFGDTTDIEWWKKYKLPLRVSIDKDGKLNKIAGKYEGKKLFEARKLILESLKKEKRLIKQETLKQVVGACWRCETPIEYVITKQWFIKILKYKNQLIKQGKKINWHPNFFFKRYESWVKNLNWDWCISRQRYYGVPIPIWYCKKCGKPNFPNEKDLPIDPTKDKLNKKCSCGNDKFEPEKDVFDTWMTSSMTPQISTRWLEEKKEFNKRFPVKLRAQSHDIIRTWAFYTILKSYLHFKKIPWKDIIINTFVLDEKGKGMSKSKGNAIWVNELFEKYSIDAFRYWVGTTSYGSDIPFNEKELISGEKTVSKLWNASKFAIMHLEDYDFKKPKKIESIDLGLLAKLNELVKFCTEKFDRFEYSKATQELHKFFWNVFCDNYLEIAKDRLYNADKRGEISRKSAQYTLHKTLLTILKLFAPIVPFITEEIYQLYFVKNEKIKSIHTSEWPKYDKKLKDKISEKSFDVFIDLLNKVRQEKSKNNKSLKEEVILTLPNSTKKVLIDSLDDLKAVCKAREIEIGPKFEIKW
jgi:valyl-tRNA synthetase